MLALIPLLAGLIPEVAKLLAGDRAGTAAAQVVDVAQAVLGTSDPVQAQVALQDPEKLGAIRVRLAEIAAQREAAAEQSRLETFKAAVTDTANARELTGKSTMIAWAQVIFGSVIVAVIAINALAPLFTNRGFSIDPFLATVFGTVMGFFYGNSTASNAANSDRAALAATLSNFRTPQPQSPPAIATTGDVNVEVARSPSPPGTTADDLMAPAVAQIQRPRIRVPAGTSTDDFNQPWKPSERS